MQFGYFVGGICLGMIAKRMESLQLSIANILAKEGSRHWNLPMRGYKRITLFTWPIVPVQCFSENFSAPIHR